jgi:geranylgeranyl pyrophosphate synthase
MSANSARNGSEGFEDARSTLNETIDSMARRRADFAASFSRSLRDFLNPPDGVPAELHDAMAHALLGEGKRLRPYLIDRCVALVEGDPAPALVAGAAIEMVHAFSLVHDDLPAMDDDDLRRGRPTCHKVFGEATAILAGDALLALAVELLATRVPDAVMSRALIAELIRGTGWSGMIGGQVDDLAGEHQPLKLARVRAIHRRKTGALFVAACRMGGICGAADAETLDALGAYGTHLGQAFQIADDLLDVTATADQLGKNVSKDAARRKQSYPACVGEEAARAAGADAVRSAEEALARFGPAADELRALARYALDRRK